MKRYIKSSSDGRRFYACTDNIVPVGYKYYVVSFNSRKKRDEFIRNSYGYQFHAISSKELKNALEPRVFKELQTYIDTIFDTDGRYCGLVFFDYDGNFHSIDWK